jgi:uncharacterized membrane protein (UPF0182 family)
MKPHRVAESGELLIDVGSRGPRRLRWWVLAGVIVFLLLATTQVLPIYIEALWFGSVGYASVFWYTFRLQAILFVVFGVATFVVLRVVFFVLTRMFRSLIVERRIVVVGDQQVVVAPARLLRGVAWVVAVVPALFYGFAMSDNWQTFALYLNQPATSVSDPVFQKPLGFFLFALPVYDLLSGWLSTLAFVALLATLLYVAASIPEKETATAFGEKGRGRRYAAISFALAAVLLVLAWDIFLARFPYLWRDHQTFTGVSYTEAHYVLPGLVFVGLALLASVLVALVNAFTRRGWRLLVLAGALPVAVYVVGVILIPGYVQGFVVKPNELDRETPFIKQNIDWTRQAFKLEQVTVRDHEADTSQAAFDLENNRDTLENIRLWDRDALQATLTQIQEIRNYYEFAEVDVDRYQIGDRQRQVMIAARELNVDALPESSRNWINQRLIYTHGYGVTMNTANGFTPEGRPQFTLSNMPVESTAPEIKMTRPQIYFGSKTDTDVYVRTRQQEFDYPQGEANTFTTYEGTGGIPVGSGLRRLALAWALGDISKLPFSDDVTAESRVLMRRNVIQRVRTLAPFLIYDNDPFIIINQEGRLFWMIDAYTETDRYPYARHADADGHRVNYIRNSVKVTIDAYNGDVRFYVFDEEDPLLKAFRKIFPALFQPASAMPGDLRAHVRYPDTLIQTQGTVFGLYHTTNPKLFFQREDVWSVASVNVPGQEKNAQPRTLRPYFALMRLPGIDSGRPEFVRVVLFTPANRNNLIAWMAGRSDGDAYGSLFNFNLPQSRLIDGPLQVEARIDQDPQLSGQFTLWNQQGSRIQRGTLMAIPIGRGLLYVQPIYLQAERSPMPELRLVVVATQEKVAFGPNFASALTSLFGEAAGIRTKAEAPKPGEDAKAEPAAPVQTDVRQLVNRANQEFNEYQRFTSEGKLAEAGQRLEALKRTLEELQKAQGKSQ